MKRFVLLLALLCSVAANAQVRQQTYGDTMFARLDSFYYAPFWVYDDWVALSSPGDVNYCEFRHDPEMMVTPTCGYGGNLRYHYTDNSINIIGLACVGYSYQYGSSSPTEPLHNMGNDPTSASEFLSLWDATPDSVYQVGSLEWSPADPCRYLKLPLIRKPSLMEPDTAPCTYFYCDTAVLEMREYYFEKPIPVQDSFYVGGTYNSYHFMEHFDATYVFPDYSFVVTSASHDLSLCNTHFENYLVIRCNHGQTTPIRYYQESAFFQLIFPLYEVPPTIPQGGNSCVRPTGLRLDDMTPRDGVAFISWDDLEHHTSWDVALGDTLFETIRHELLPLTGLRQGETYSVAVRAHCQFSDTLFYSDWSDTLTFTLSDDGIRVIADSRGQISVFPNPTTGDVTVDCGSLKVERIELLDLQGRVLLREEPTKPNTQLPTSSLVPGAYLIRVHAEEGTFTRRVVKE